MIPKPIRAISDFCQPARRLSTVKGAVTGKSTIVAYDHEDYRALIRF